MATRNIAITDEAYKLLAARKGPRESFTDVILRMGGRVDLTQFAGVLTHKEAEQVRRVIQEDREALRKRGDRIVKAFR